MTPEDEKTIKDIVGDYRGPKVQWSKFSPDRSEQYVIRVDTYSELEELRAFVLKDIPKSKAFPEDEGPIATPPEKVQAKANDFCEVHNKQMKQRTSPDGATFYSHAQKVGDNWQYCSGKGWK